MRTNANIVMREVAAQTDCTLTIKWETIAGNIAVGRITRGDACHNWEWFSADGFGVNMVITPSQQHFLEQVLGIEWTADYTITGAIQRPGFEQLMVMPDRYWLETLKEVVLNHHAQIILEEDGMAIKRSKATGLYYLVDSNGNVSHVDTEPYKLLQHLV